MYHNPLLAALFEDSLSDASTRLEQTRLMFNNSGGLVLVLPSTNAALELDPATLYTDKYLLSHIAKLPAGVRDFRKGCELTTLSNGVLHVGEFHVRPIKGFPSNEPVAIDTVYKWNPGVNYVSPERSILVIELKGLLIQSKLPIAEISPVQPKKDLEQILGRKKGQRAKTSAILRPLLLAFNVKDYDDPAKMGAAFRSTVNNAFNQIHSILDAGYDLLDALQDYFEYQTNFPVLEQLNQLNTEHALCTLQPAIAHLDLSQVDLPIGIHKHEKLVNQVAHKLGALNMFHTVAETAEILVDCLGTLARGFDADSLLGLLLIVVVRSQYRFLDIIPSFIRHFSKESVNPDAGKLGYAILTLESVVLHIRENKDLFVELSASNKQFWEHIHAEEWTAALQLERSFECGAGFDVLFHLIRTKQNEPLREFLGKFSPEYVLKDRDETDATLLFAAIESYNRQATDYILDVLSEFSDDVLSRHMSVTDEQERSIAHLMQYNDTLIAKVGHLVDWTHRDNHGLTPLLILAACYDHTDYEGVLYLAISKWQQSKAVSLYDHVDDSGNTLLHIINPTGNSLLAKLRAVQGFDVNYPNARGRTPLMLAAKYDRHDYMRQLLDLGADLWQLDSNFMSVFDHAKGASLSLAYEIAVAQQTSHSELRALKASRGNCGCVVSIFRTDCRAVYRSFDEFLALCTILDQNYPLSWVPHVRFEDLSIDPWNVYKIDLRRSAYIADYFVMQLSSHATFKHCEEVLEFCYSEGSFEPELSKSGVQHWQKHQDIDGTSKLSYSDQETHSIVTFFQFSIEQLKTFRLLYTRLSLCLIKIHNVGSAFRSSVGHMSQYLVKFDGRPKLGRLCKRFSSSLDSPCVSEHPALAYLTSEARSTASLIEALEKPVQLISDLKQCRLDLEAHRLELMSLGEQKSWPIMFFEEKRTKAIQDKEAELLETRRRIKTLTQDIAGSHEALASELSSYSEFRGVVMMDVMRGLAEKSIRRNKHWLLVLESGLHDLRGKHIY